MKRDISSHTLREEILAVVEANPGIHLREIARRFGIRVNLADYHLRVLEKGGRVMSVAKAGRKGFFSSDPDGERPPLTQADRRVLLILREAQALLITLFLMVTGGARSGEVAKEVGISPSTASHHLGKLTAEGIIERTAGGTFVVCDPERLARLIIDHRPGEESVVDSFESLWEELSRHSE